MSYASNPARKKRRRVLALSVTPAAISALPFLGSCQISTPFRGPAFEGEQGSGILDAQGQIVVAITEGRVEGPGDFWGHLRRVEDALARADGLLGYSLRTQIFGRTVWTMSAWKNRDALQNFLRSRAHRDAVRDGGIPRSSVRSRILEVDAQTFPLPWRRALSLVREAR